MSKRQDYYKTKEIEKYAFGISTEARTVLTDMLDSKEVSQEELYQWLKETYEKENAIHYLCENCVKASNCLRSKNKVKTCKLYEREEQE